MLKPDYETGSIVNLMASLAQSMGASTNPYAPLSSLNSKQLAESQNLILLVIDGLGYEFLQKYRQDSFIAQHIKQSLTSVFPSTTATAITAFATALPAQQHAITGWYMYFKEIKQVMAVLPFTPRGEGRKDFTFEEMQQVINLPTPLVNRINRQSFVINPRFIAESNYNRLISGKAQRIGYDSLEQCFSQIKQTCQQNKEKKYIYAYWPEFDACCHENGTAHEKTMALFKTLDVGFERLIESLSGENFQLILTADHGLINASEENTILLNDYPAIRDCLAQPLCGEPRAAYCYVKPELQQQFENRVKQELGVFCDLYKVEELIEQHYFGLHQPSSLLSQRLGNYVLLMKNNFIIRDFLEDEKKFTQTGVHGGLSPEELLVPLAQFGS